jgi:catechol 2,3-dioxygenase-like lactoylglutathione lyase family enzyme
LVPVIAVHGLFYTPQPVELRAFLRDVLGWEYVEDPHSEPGWLIFKLPPAELGVHPSDGSTKHELAFMCDDIAATMAELRDKGIEFRGEAEDLGFGIGATMVLPGGVEVLLYESRHVSPLDL